MRKLLTLIFLFLTTMITARKTHYIPNEWKSPRLRPAGVYMTLPDDGRGDPFPASSSGAGRRYMLRIENASSFISEEPCI